MRSRMVETNGVTLRVTEAGEPGRRWWCSATASPNWRTPGATRSPRWPTPAITCWPLTSAATAVRSARGRRRLHRRRADPRTRRAARRRRRASARRWSAMTGAPSSPGPRRCCTPTGSRGRRAEPAAGAAPEGADHAGVPPDLRRQLLLHPLLPGARARRRRAGRGSGDHVAAPVRDAAGAATTAAALRMLAPGPQGFLDRIPEPGGLPDWISQSELRPLRRRVHPRRIHRAAELVPQLRPQLGADGRHRPRRRSPCPRCSSAAPPTPRWPTRPATGPARSSPATTAR